MSCLQFTKRFRIAFLVFSLNCTSKCTQFTIGLLCSQYCVRIIMCVYITHYSDRQVLYGNIMYDRRIVRGNTYALTYPTGVSHYLLLHLTLIKTLSTILQASKPDPLEQQRNQEARRRAQARRRAKEQMRVRSPDPVEGRKHIDVQTELYLEEITGQLFVTIEILSQHQKLPNKPTMLYMIDRYQLFS